MNIEIGDSVKIVNAIDPIKMVVIDKIDNEHLTAVYWLSLIHISEPTRPY